jgi:RNA polymerase sigma-70 factor (ECF subfamily)
VVQVCINSGIARYAAKGILLSSTFNPGSAAPSSSADEELAATLRKGEPGALEQAYERYSRPVFALLLRMTGERSVAEDLLQETFLRLWRRAGTFDTTRGAFLPWLLTVARNLALDRIRSSAERRRRREDPAEHTPEPSIGGRGEAWVDDRRTARNVSAALETFPVEQRRAIELAYFEGMSHGEVATAMDRPLGAVKTWIRTALLSLKQELGGAA